MLTTVRFGIVLLTLMLSFAPVQAALPPDPVYDYFQKLGEVIEEGITAYGNGELSDAMAAFVAVEEQLDRLPMIPKDSQTHAMLHIHRSQVVLAAGRPVEAAFLARSGIADLSNRHVRGAKDLDPPLDVEQRQQLLCTAQGVIAWAEFTQGHYSQAITASTGFASGNSDPKLCDSTSDVRSVGLFALRAQGRSEAADLQASSVPRGHIALTDQATVGQLIEVIAAARKANDPKTEANAVFILLSFAGGLQSGDKTRRDIESEFLVRAVTLARRIDQAKLAVELAEKGLAAERAGTIDASPQLQLRYGEALFDLSRFQEAETVLDRYYRQCGACTKNEKLLTLVTRRAALLRLGRFAEADRVRVTFMQLGDAPR